MGIQTVSTSLNVWQGGETVFSLGLAAMSSSVIQRLSHVHLSTWDFMMMLNKQEAIQSLVSKSPLSKPTLFLHYYCVLSLPGTKATIE